LIETAKYAFAYHRYANNNHNRQPYIRAYEITEQEVLWLKDEATKWRNLALGMLQRQYGDRR
jgi:hypothetical protein